MISREIVMRSLEFRSPGRIPMSLPSPYSNNFVEAGLGPNPYASEEGVCI